MKVVHKEVPYPNRLQIWAQLAAENLLNPTHFPKSVLRSQTHGVINWGYGYTGQVPISDQESLVPHTILSILSFAESRRPNSSNHRA